MIHILKGISSSKNNMKNSKWTICLVYFLLWSLSLVEAQTTLVVQEAEIVSRSLSGHVNIGLQKRSGTV
jgi:hypothetical protein